MLSTDTNKTRCCIYTRVSTMDQVDNFGLPIQEERCMTMVKYKDYLFTKVYSDPGVSGTYGADKRPGLKQLLDDAQDKKFDAIIVYALDRLGRKTLLVLNLLEQIKDLHIDLISCKENLDTSTPIGSFFVTMITGINQLERDNIVARMKEGSVIRAKIDGDKGGSLPYGYKRGEDSTLEINEDEAVVVRLIFDLRAKESLTQVKIVEYLNKSSYPTKKGTPWTQGVISKILKRRDIYEGCLRNNNDNNVRWPKLI